MMQVHQPGCEAIQGGGKRCSCIVAHDGHTVSSSPVLIPDDDAEDVHTWFELTYAQYLTVPRSILQSMPEEWQARFVKCLRELDDAFDWHPKEGRYWVQLKDSRGRYVHDPLMAYDRGRRQVPRREGAPA